MVAGGGRCLHGDRAGHPDADVNLAEVGVRARVVESDLNDPGCCRGVAVAALAVAVATVGASKAAVVGLHVVPTAVVAPLDRISGIDRQLRWSEDVAADLDDMSLLSMKASGHEGQSRDDPTKRDQRVADHELSFGSILWGLLGYRRSRPIRTSSRPHPLAQTAAVAESR